MCKNTNGAPNQTKDQSRANQHGTLKAKHEALNIRETCSTLTEPRWAFNYKVNDMGELNKSQAADPQQVGENIQCLFISLFQIHSQKLSQFNFFPICIQTFMSNTV